MGGGETHTVGSDLLDRFISLALTRLGSIMDQTSVTTLGTAMDTCMDWHFLVLTLTFGHPSWVEELGRLGAAGANHVRVWVHVEGDVR